MTENRDEPERLPVQAVADPANALSAAIGRGRRVVVAGSLFLVGAVRAALDAASGRPDPA